MLSIYIQVGNGLEKAVWTSQLQQTVEQTTSLTKDFYKLSE